MYLLTTSRIVFLSFIIHLSLYFNNVCHVADNCLKELALLTNITFKSNTLIKVLLKWIIAHITTKISAIIFLEEQILILDFKYFLKKHKLARPFNKNKFAKLYINVLQNFKQTENFKITIFNLITGKVLENS